MKDTRRNPDEATAPDDQDAEGPEFRDVEQVPDAGAPPADRGLGPNEVCWEFIIANPADLSPEELETAATRGVPIEIRLWGNDLEKFYRLIRQSAIDEQIRATLDRHVASTAAKLEAMADNVGAESGGPAGTFGDVLARELIGGIARQPHLVGPLRGVLQGPVGAAATGNTVLMKRADYAKRIAVCPRKLDDLIKQGLPTAGKGRMVRVKVTDADRWVRDNLDGIEAPEENIAHDARARARATSGGRR